VFAFEESAAGNELAVGGSMANLDALVVGINYPGELCAAGEEVFQARINFGAGVGWARRS
jgi:hypothetical protein